MRPPSRKSTRSQASSTRSGRCSETTTAAPDERASSIAAAAPSGSSWEVGSSRSRSRGLERERRGEADALQLAAGELGHRPVGEVGGADRVSASSARGRSPPAGCRRSRARRRPRRATRVKHDLVLGVLEERRDRPGELGRPRAARVAAGDLDAAREAAAVEMRHEPGERAQQRRLARARRRRAARRPRPARRRASTSPSAGRAARVRERESATRR